MHSSSSNRARWRQYPAAVVAHTLHIVPASAARGVAIPWHHISISGCGACRSSSLEVLNVKAAGSYSIGSSRAAEGAHWGRLQDATAVLPALHGICRLKPSLMEGSGSFLQCLRQRIVAKVHLVMQLLLPQQECSTTTAAASTAACRTHGPAAYIAAGHGWPAAGQQPSVSFQRPAAHWLPLSD